MSELEYVEVEAKQYRSAVRGISKWSSRVYFGTKENRYSFKMPYQHGSTSRDSEYASINELGKYVNFSKKGKYKTWEAELKDVLGSNYQWQIKEASEEEAKEWGK